MPGLVLCTLACGVREKPKTVSSDGVFVRQPPWLSTTSIISRPTTEEIVRIYLAPYGRLPAIEALEFWF